MFSMREIHEDKNLDGLDGIITTYGPSSTSGLSRREIILYRAREIPIVGRLIEYVRNRYQERRENNYRHLS